MYGPQPLVAHRLTLNPLAALLKEKPKHEGEANGKADDADKKESDEFGTPENTRVAAAAALGAAAVKARVMAEKEDRVVQRLVTQAVEVRAASSFMCAATVGAVRCDVYARIQRRDQPIPGTDPYV